MNYYKVEYDWVEEFLLRELPKYELRREPTMTQAEQLEILVPTSRRSFNWGFGWGFAVAIVMIIMILVGRSV